MRQTPGRGFTFVELIAVLTIAAALLALLLPAVLRSRRAADRAACASNLHQLGVAMTNFVELRRKVPDPAPADTIGGWVIELLPFLDDTNLADRLGGRSLLADAAALELARQRPHVLTCPSAYEGPSNIALVPASHYLAALHRTEARHKLHWELGECTTDSRIPWVTSAEQASGLPERVTSQSLYPHDGGYNRVAGFGRESGGVIFMAPAE